MIKNLINKELVFLLTFSFAVGHFSSITQSNSEKINDLINGYKTQQSQIEDLSDRVLVIETEFKK